MKIFNKIINFFFNGIKFLFEESPMQKSLRDDLSLFMDYKHGKFNYHNKDMYFWKNNVLL